MISDNHSLSVVNLESIGAAPFARVLQFSPMTHARPSFAAPLLESLVWWLAVRSSVLCASSIGALKSAVLDCVCRQGADVGGTSREPFSSAEEEPRPPLSAAFCLAKELGCF